MLCHVSHVRGLCMRVSARAALQQAGTTWNRLTEKVTAVGTAAGDGHDGQWRSDSGCHCEAATG